MIPYFRKFGRRLKQRMPMKPIRYGYKVWCLNLKGGYLYDFKVYHGKGSKMNLVTLLVWVPVWF